jgi:hypothetical protein
MPNTSMQVNFGLGATDAFRLILDGLMNNQVTTFTVGQDVFLRLYPGNHHPTLYSMRGTVRFDVENIVETITEELIFLNTDSASLQYPAASTPTILWEGRPLVNAIVDGNAVKLSEVATGILTIEYTTIYDRLVATSAIVGKDIIEAQSADRYGALVLEYFAEISALVTIDTTAMCKGERIEGASVAVDGGFVGITNENGEVTGTFTLGVQHSIQVRKEGFLNTEDDLVANDFFTCAITDDDRRRATTGGQ